MEISVNVCPQFESVFLINGKIFEGGIIEYKLDSVVYITCLPLDASLLPYTVKMVGFNVKSNDNLASCYKLPNENYHLSLLPRYNYVYSPQINKPSLTIGQRFFNFLANGKLASAREMLTSELSSSIDDNSLKDFFKDFKDIILIDNNLNTYYLISKDNIAYPFTFILKDNLIDNILETNNN